MIKRGVNVFLIVILMFMNMVTYVPVKTVGAEGKEENKKTIFEADFNHDQVGEVPSGFSVLEDGGTVRIVDIPDPENKSVFLDDTSESEFVKLEKSLDNLESRVTVKMKFMQPEYTSFTKIMRLKGDGNSVTIETNNGYISYRNSDDTYIDLIELNEGNWYDIQVEVDFDTQTVAVYIDDQLKLEDVEFYQSATMMNIFETFTPGNGAKGHYVDDIIIFQNVESEQGEDLETVFLTDFNEGTVGEVPEEVEVSESGGTVRIADVPSNENKSVYLDDTSDATNVILSKSFEDLSRFVSIEMKFMQPEYTSATKIMRLKGDGTPVIIETNGGNINYRIGSEFYPIVPLEEGKWYEIKVDIDLETSSANIYVDGDLQIENAPFNEPAKKINFFETFTSNSGTKGHYIDDLKITGIILQDDEQEEPINEPEKPDHDGVNGIYEAEYAEFEGAIIDNKHVGFTGIGFVDYYPNAPGGWIEWTVNVPVDGVYNLNFRYAHGGTDLRPASIEVNGEVIEPELPFDPTGDWANWVYTSTSADLLEGTNVIRVTGVGPSGGANIDHLRVHNIQDSSDNENIEVESSELSDVVSELQLKKLEEIGIIVADDLIHDEEPITTLQFMSLINDRFGFVKNETFKNLNNQAEIWGISLDEWYAYVIEAANEAGYMDAFVQSDNLDLDKELTKQEANVIIASLPGSTLLEIDVEDALLTWGEAREVVDSLAGDHELENVQMVGVHAIANDLLAVILNSSFDEFDYSDLEVVVPTRAWQSLSPGFQKLRIDKAAQGMNMFGQTVLILHSLDEWDENGEYEFETEDSSFQADLEEVIQQANNLLTWQMDHGGWTKNWPHIYTRPWDGEELRSEWVHNGIELGTIDNDATISEIIFMAQVYNETRDIRYKESVEKALDFLFHLQYPSGGFAQVYPSRGNYSDYVTFNDQAMINVLDMMDDILKHRYPFNSDVISDEYYRKIEESMEKGIDYILKSQIEVDGKLTAWGQQHHPETYEPMPGRSYELVSISGSESVGIIRFLMSRPQRPEINHAIKSALEWLDEVKLEGIRYVSGDPNEEYFVEDPNSTAWYRFYEIGTNKPIFSDRDGVKKHHIMEIGEERRNGYSWGGHWGTQLLAIAKETGYYENKVFVQVVDTNSVDKIGKTLQENDILRLKSQTKQIDEIQNEIVVAQDGSGDYETVQEAIDAVPSNNSEPVTIFIKNGVYKEVVTVPVDKPFITLIGESATKTIITYDNYAGKDNGVGGTLGTTGSSSVFLRADDFRAENITFENSFDVTRDVEGKQAVAVYASGERMYFRNVRFLGHQDTLYVHSGSQYFYQVYVEGDVDFIFGGARAVFEDSEIHSLDRGSTTNNGYITAASTSIHDPFGILILRSRITSDAAPGTVYLGRPWQAGGNPENVASVVFMESELGEHIHEDGWTSMSGFQPEDARLYEYNNFGPGAVVNDSRRQLTDEEAAEWTVENVLGWDPQVVFPGDLPGEPGGPSDPSDPEEPGGPGDPSDPSDPEEPGEPGGPSDPSDPEEPGEPDDPSDPSDPEKPGKPEPSDSVDLEEPGGIDLEDEDAEQKLPKTATFSYNLIVIGFIIIIIGGGILLRNRYVKRT